MLNNILLFSVQISLIGITLGGNVLIWPMEGSHCLNVKIIIDELIEKEHNVTLLVASGSLFITPTSNLSLTFEIYKVPSGHLRLEELIQDYPSPWVRVRPDPYTFWLYFSEMQEITWRFGDIIRNFCKDVVSNKKLMKKLQESRFDVVFADPTFPCSELLAELFNIPLVYSLRFIPGYVFEKHCGGFLFPPSYVPAFMSELSDQMTFMERVKNMIYMLYFDFCYQMHDMKKWDQFYSEVLGRPTTLCETMGKADIWLIRNSWNFQFPHPLLPNVDFVGGLHCKPVKPLPKEMEEFVQSSGENGVVVFTLGSMVTNMKEERANVIASALAQIPQKVLWRFDGNKPDTLGLNTRLYKWIPQNDLLGHPKTRAFITHGGANGIYEAIYHGVPMVGIPLFADQPDNIAHMKARGAAVQLDFDTMSSTDLANALKTVINDPLYKENVMKLSRIQHDQPVKPLDRAVFWIEFVMRHKGAKHLRVAAHDLTWFQYHSLDVIGFLLACVATVIFIIMKCCLFCFWKFTRKGKKGKSD
ncbi:PREDICTED: UDP-glucuronosyltransferase 2B9 isoform X6 [Colobus angolensis palliatus]|uniref:UDP-glucuronosyltransferase 2B9 isoform X6 n=1 Tax=Colobus angolensis palliatus TaxID=336983 RepID=UPI0005F51843|nr:PREDICTED: UDP-glucuronosyltransferase 2B9 isoform X6 [Colobus angolensis palliatus]